MEDLTRRKFVIQSSKLLTLIPFAGVIGCISDADSKLSPKKSLKKLIFILGPWTPKDKLIAEGFANRFLKADYIISQYLPKSAKTIQSLSLRFQDDIRDVKEIDLKKIPKEEQELLMMLGKQLYSFVEVRFYVSNEPSWGDCQGNAMWHTRIPM